MPMLWFFEIKQRGNPTLIEHLTDRGFYDDAENGAIANSVIEQLRRNDTAMEECEAPPVVEAPVVEAMVDGSAAADMIVECEQIWLFSANLNIVSFLVFYVRLKRVPKAYAEVIRGGRE